MQREHLKMCKCPFVLLYAHSLVHMPSLPPVFDCLCKSEGRQLGESYHVICGTHVTGFCILQEWRWGRPDNKASIQIF